MMIDLLDQVLMSDDLAALWRDASAWRGMFIDYEHPHVERLYATLPASGERPALRVMLHCIHPCKPGQPLMHAHPWPSAVRILLGRYEHITRAAPHDKHSEVKSVLARGSAYEIASPHVWHSVRPIGMRSYSVMLAGEPWPRNQAPKPPTQQRDLTPAEFDDLRRRFANLLGFGT